jgi:dienelactone hydrolase
MGTPNETDAREIRGEFVATYYPPRDAERRGTCILVLGGSEGGLPDFFAQMFTSQGYATMALAYCGFESLPPRIDRIPLEYFRNAIDWLLKRPELVGARLVIGAISKGAELALLLASRDCRIRGVIAYSPSSVVFQGIPDEDGVAGASWTWEGEPLVHVPYDLGGGRPPDDIYGLYCDSLRQTEEVIRATIPVEQINGPVLLFSGGQDKMWPSGEMAEMICQRLKAHRFPHRFSHKSFEQAGHVFSEYVTELGGTAEANRDAGFASAEIAFEFLSG